MKLAVSGGAPFATPGLRLPAGVFQFTLAHDNHAPANGESIRMYVMEGGGGFGAVGSPLQSHTDPPLVTNPQGVAQSPELVLGPRTEANRIAVQAANAHADFSILGSWSDAVLNDLTPIHKGLCNDEVQLTVDLRDSQFPPPPGQPTQCAVNGARIGVEVTDGGGWILTAGRLVRAAMFETDLSSQVSFDCRLSSREEKTTIRVYVLEAPVVRLDIIFEAHRPHLLSCETALRSERTDIDATTWLSKMVRVGTTDVLQDRILDKTVPLVDHVEIGLRNLTSGAIVYPAPRAGWGGMSTLVTRPPRNTQRVEYELWLPDFPDDAPPFRTVDVPAANRYAGPPVTVTAAPAYVECQLGGVRDINHGVEISNPRNDVQYIGPDPAYKSKYPYTFTLQTSRLQDPHETVISVTFSFKVRSTPDNSIFDDPNTDPNEVPGAISLQLGGPYSDSLTLMIDLIATPPPCQVAIYYKTSQQDRDCVVETTASVIIRHEQIDPQTGYVISSYDYPAVTTLLARALFLRPRLSFTKKGYGGAIVPVDDEAIVPAPTIDPGGNIIPHKPEREFYLEYRTHDPDATKPRLTVSAKIFGGSLEHDLILTKIASTVECAVYQSRPIVCYLEQPGTCGLAAFDQLIKQTTYEYVLVQWADNSQDRPYSVTASLTPPVAINPLQKTFWSPTRPSTFLNIEAAGAADIVPQVPAPGITLDCFDNAQQDFPVDLDTTVAPPAIKLALNGTIRDAVGDLTPLAQNRIDSVTINGVTFTSANVQHSPDFISKVRPFAALDKFTGEVVLKPGFNTVQVSAKNKLGVVGSRTVQVEVLDTKNAFNDKTTMAARVRVLEEPLFAPQGTPLAFVHYRTPHGVSASGLLPQTSANVDVESLDVYPNTSPPLDRLTVPIRQISRSNENTYVSGPILIVPDTWDPAAVADARQAGIVLLQQKPGSRLLVHGTLPTRLGDVEMQTLGTSTATRFTMLVKQGATWNNQTRLKVGDHFTFEVEYLNAVNPGTQEVVVSAGDRLGRSFTWPNWFLTLVMGFDPARNVWTMLGYEDLATGALVPAAELVAISRHGQYAAGEVPLRVLGGGTIQVGHHWYWSVDHDPLRQPLGTGLAPQESRCRTSARMGARGTVLARTGELVLVQNDVTLNGRGLDLSFTRTYRSFLEYDGPVGCFWSHSLHSWLHRLSPDTYLMVGATGRLATFSLQPSGAWFPDQPGVYATLNIDTDANIVIVQWAGGDREVFAPRAEYDPDYLPLVARYDRYRNKVGLLYDQSGRLIRADDPLNQPLHFVHDILHRIVTVGDGAERLWSYGYWDGTKAGGLNGDLQFADAPAVTWANDPHPPARRSYIYDSAVAHKLKQLQDPKGNQQNLPPLMEMTWYPDGRVNTQQFGDGSYTFSYAGTQTTILDRKHNKRTFDFKAGLSGELDTLAITHIAYDTNGTPYATAYDYNSQGEVKSVTPPAGSMTPASEYDFNDTAGDPRDRGNLTHRRLLSVPRLQPQYRNLYQTVALDVNTDPQPTQVAKLEWVWDYGSVTHFQQPLTLTDPLQRKTTYHYDFQNPGGGRVDGNLVQVDDPPVTANVMGGTLQQYITQHLYDNFGQILWTVNPAGVVTRYQYYPGNAPNGGLGVNPVTAPDQRPGHLFRTSLDTAVMPPTPQPVVRSRSLTPPEERRVDYVYDVHGYVEALSDPARNQTVFHYDELGVLKQRIIPDGPAVDYYHDANSALIKQSANIADLNFPAGVALPPPPTPLPTRLISIFDYDRPGNPTTTTVDQGGLNLIMKREYDPNENLTLIHTPISMKPGASAAAKMRYTKNEYDGLDRLVHTTLAPDVVPARRIDLEYFPDGKLKSRTDANGYSTRYFYNCFGFAVEEMDKDGNSHRTWRDLLGHVTVLEKYGSLDGSAANQGTLNKSFVYLDELDREIAHADLVFRWDSTLTQQNIGRRVTQWIHDPAGNIVETINPRQYHTTTQFNGYGQRRGTHSPLTGDTSWSYDANGNLHTVTLPPAPGFPALQLLQNHDACNRKISEQKLGGGTLQFRFNTLGNLRMTQDQVGNRVFHEYDAAGRPTRMLREMRDLGSYPNPVNDVVVTEYVYDLNNNLLKVIDANQTVAIEYTHEAHDQVESTTYPDDSFVQAALVRPGARRTATSAYHPNGLLQTSTTPDGFTVTNEYTNARLIAKRTVTAPAGVQITGTTLQTFVYDGAGRCVSAGDNNGDPHKSAIAETRYDSLNNIWEDRQKESFSGSGARTDWPRATFNPFGELDQLTYPGFPVPIKYGFDPAGRPAWGGQFASYGYKGAWLTSRGNSLNQIQLSATHNAQGLIGDHLVKDLSTGKILGGNRYKQWNEAAFPVIDEVENTATSALLAPASPSGLSEEYVYDSACRILTNIKLDRQSQPASISTMKYDRTGNPILLQTGSTANPNESRWSERVVNGANQIGQTIEHVDPNASFNWLKIAAGAAIAAESFVLGPAGLAGLAGGGALIYAGYSAKANPGLFGYFYDARGNIVRKEYNGQPQVEFAYDVFDRLVSATDRTSGKTTRFYYDAFGRRVAKDNTAFSWLGNHLLQEEPGSGGWHKHYFFASDDLAGFATDQHGSLEQYFVHDDRGGTILFLSDNAGDIRESYAYDLFGKPKILDFQGHPVAPNGGKGNFFLHQGQYYDIETGLYCVGSRYYDPLIQRFLQPDKVAWDIDTNRYSYAANNTQCLSDPSGNIAVLVALALAAAGAAVVGFAAGAALSAAQQTMLYIDTKGESGFSLQSIIAAGAMGAVCGAAISLWPQLAIPAAVGFGALGIYGAVQGFREGHFRAGALDAALALMPFWHGVRSAFRDPAPSTTEIYFENRASRRPYLKGAAQDPLPYTEYSGAPVTEAQVLHMMAEMGVDIPRDRVLFHEVSDADLFERLQKALPGVTPDQIAGIDASYGSTTRVPERFPLSSMLARNRVVVRYRSSMLENPERAVSALVHELYEVRQMLDWFGNTPKEMRAEFFQAMTCGGDNSNWHGRAWDEAIVYQLAMRSRGWSASPPPAL